MSVHWLFGLRLWGQGYEPKLNFVLLFSGVFFFFGTFFC